ncbi:MAG: VPLPA-CTERM-specific exosortase XrtD [Chromatiales bacterium]|jgi:exosortase D (VPLPA-CTERM-specific)|nr:VPLPA-CTERM-specific exosortase XrtD [Chromatiales bacterium]
MNQASLDAPPSQVPAVSAVSAGILNVVIAAIVAACLLVIYDDAITWMLKRWGADEYNHAYMIPFVAFYLFWLRTKKLQSSDPVGSWLGLVVIASGLVLQLLGSLSAVLEISQYGLVVAIWGVAIAAVGLRSMSLMWVPLVYLVFMVPLPTFMQTSLTAGLQLLSSQIGVMVIRAAGLSVFLEGNVIDLGSYQLQVAEACSGMRYLFPLMSFGFLCAVLMRGRWWQQAILFVSTIPITILMNSLRIGIIGILVNYYGIEQAEGFLHDFEGWVIFMSCVVILFTEIWIFARMEKQKFLEIFGLDTPVLSDLTSLVAGARPNRQVLAGTALLVAAAIAALTVTRPPMKIPVHAPMQTFPMRIGDWEGRDVPVEQASLDTLKLSDFINSAYVRPSEGAPVSLWIAYYDTQVQGVSAHSPRACLPGGGWRIESIDEYLVPEVGPDGSPRRVNRAVIAMGEQRQLVYYWFAQRGRNVTNEFAVKWYIFRDGLFMNRTDGALVRLVTHAGDASQLPAADARLQEFLRDINPKLDYFLPGESVPFKTATSVIDAQ